ncbi:type-F conjugative transfer system protein TraW [Arsenophonus nasoniae]|uniref:Type-F conjugative transfer system protein TraW n=1 Tax=Arsenophonus nasoniae TaxID=638 RepID=A0AA95GUQ1_9GAMM|nr:type-F conjugative transfer system protein TraW [Arsenophonus nasoniae]WGM03631.1 type-F conjugative transfer system protein TraW [Arsenophonus nasoniae]
MKKGLWVALFISQLACARDFGVTGEIWPIAERNILTLIEGRLTQLMNDGSWEKEMRAFKTRVRHHAQRPEPVGLTVAQHYSERFFDPSIRLSEDLKDDKGRVFAPKGKLFNPLKFIPFNQTLYFIDGDDPKQVAWMQAQQPQTLLYKIILVGGDVAKAADSLNRRVYFDQQGVLSRKLGLTTVPSKVTAAASGLRLRIETFPVRVL